jgi:radical SAM protein with 4Fe4S-binding SPASM domain
VTDTTTTNGGDGRGVLSLRERLRARAAARAVPLKLHLELTKRCNLRCYHCYLSEPGPELSTERVLHLLDEVAELGCMGVILTGGEIAMRSDFMVVARGIKDRRMTLSLLTNGTLLSDDDLDTLADMSPASVAVSMYSAHDGAHDRVTGVPGSFARTLRTIEGLASRGVRCSIHTPLMRETLHGYVGILQLAESLGVGFMFDPTIVPGDDGDQEVTRHCVEAHELRRFYLDRVLIDKTREGKIVTRDPASEAAVDERRLLGPCAAGITSVHVAANGDVLPCMGFPPAFGSIAGRPLAEVWHGPQARRHRELMRRPPERCGECELLRYCTARCPRLAVGEGSSMRGPNRRACELATIVRDMRAQYMRST